MRVGRGVLVAVGVGDGPSVLVTVGVLDGRGVWVGRRVLVAVGVGEGPSVLVAVGVLDGPGVRVGRGVLVEVGNGVLVGGKVGDGVTVIIFTPPPELTATVTDPLTESTPSGPMHRSVTP